MYNKKRAVYVFGLQEGKTSAVSKNFMSFLISEDKNGSELLWK